jgi:predicted peptidase
MIKTSSIRVIILLSCIALMLNSNKISTQNLDAFKSDKLVLKGDILPYRILLPKNYNPNIKYPLILVLHGLGERGNDNNLQLVHGADLFLKPSVRNKYPAFVVFPQCAANDSWSNYQYSNVDGKVDITYSDKVDKIKQQQLLKELIKKLKKEFNLDANRFYVGGLSMGGMGTFDIVNQNPKLFAAAFPICGGANPKIAKRIKQPSWWIFHGAIDEVVPSKYSQQMFDALSTIGADAKLTIYPNIKHNSWTKAFAEPKLLPWLFSKSL